MRVRVRACVRACVCVCEREKERERVCECHLLLRWITEIGLIVTRGSSMHSRNVDLSPSWKNDQTSYFRVVAGSFQLEIFHEIFLISCISDASDCS